MSQHHYHDKGRKSNALESWKKRFYKQYEQSELATLEKTWFPGIGTSFGDSPGLWNKKRLAKLSRKLPCWMHFRCTPKIKRSKRSEFLLLCLLSKLVERSEEALRKAFSPSCMSYHLLQQLAERPRGIPSESSKKAIRAKRARYAWNSWFGSCPKRFWNSPYQDTPL